MTHFDAFSGLGGWALAAREAGFETIGFCENNPRAIAFLERAWGLPVHNDIKTLDGKQYHGRLTLFTASPPCQPASRAGKQGGADDDRWLWPDTLRFIAESQPDWFVVENPLGLLDLDFDGILSEMEGLGYEVQTYDIPACAVDSPQQRARLWIVGHLEHPGGVCAECGGDGGNVAGEGGRTQEEAWQRERRRDATGNSASDGAMGHAASEQGRPHDRNGRQGHPDAGGPPESRVADPGCQHGGQEQPELGQDRRTADRRDCAGDLASASERCNGRTGESGESKRTFGATDGLREWSRYVWVPCENGKVRRAPDDSFGMDHGLPLELLEALGEEEAEIAKTEYDKDGYPIAGIPHTSIIEALGNSICWPVASEILRGIAQVIEERS